MTKLKFPKDFVWGAATAAYQIEGAVHEGGRGPSIWDTFSHTEGKVKNNDTGDLACDSYHRYKEDIALMKELGISTYRFSVSWPRIFPQGTGEVNEEGLNFYHAFVDELIANDIEPMCTLYHWDLPQALEDRGGWANRETIDAFGVYAETMFKSFEGKIKKWLTINEPWCVSFLSNYNGVHAPGNRDFQLATTISHHLLVAHGVAVKKFREMNFDGEIGYAPNVTWNDPFTDRPEDVAAATRGMAWFIEWFMEPVFKGTYPDFMVEWFEEKMGATVPIKEGDMALISQPIDLMGINYYTGQVVRHNPEGDFLHAEEMDMGYDRTDINWFIHPEGFYNVLKRITSLYGEVPIYITENGACDNTGVLDGRVRDTLRTEYIRRHLISINRALLSGVNLKGYLVWSLLDNFEWAEGYTMRFGMIHVDYDTFVRTKKDSYYMYQEVISKNEVDATDSRSYGPPQRNN